MKRRVGKIIILVVVALIVLLCIGIVWAGNYLYEFALTPNTGDAVADDSGKNDFPVTEEMKAAKSWFVEDGEDRYLTSYDGLKLHARFIPQEEDRHLYAVVCHGYGSEPAGMASYAIHFYNMGFHILAPAARGHEESEGDYIGMGWHERRDVMDWVNTIIEEDSQAQIVLYGVSMGGATVMMMSGEELPDNVKCIVEDCGYSSVWDEFAVQLKEQFHLPTFPILNVSSLICKIRAGYSFTEASAVEQLKHATLPMLFIHGEEDSFVPYSMLDVVYDACASADKEKLSIPGASHGRASFEDPETYWNTVAAFTEKYIE